MSFEGLVETLVDSKRAIAWTCQVDMIHKLLSYQLK